MAGISIPITPDVGAFLRGAKQVENALDGVADSLDDLARDAARDGDRVADSLKDATAQGDKLERKFRDIADAAKDTTRQTRDVGDVGTQSMRKLGDKGAEVGDELRTNLGETFSSFRGDLEDLPQIAQDTLGGLAGSGALGGIPGLVATAAGAAGLGLLIGAFQNIGMEQDALKEKAKEWAQAYIENGGRVLSSATLVARGLDQIENNYEEVAKRAKEWGVQEETAAAALAGSPAAIAEVTSSVADLRAEYEELIKGGAVDAAGNLNGPAAAAEQAWRTARGSLDALTGAMDLGAKQADVYSYMLRDLAANTQGAVTKTDDLGDSITTLPDGTTIYIDAETGQATTDVDAIERKIYGLNGRKVVIPIDVNSSAAYAKFDAMRRDLQSRGISVPITVQDLRGGRTWQ